MKANVAMIGLGVMGSNLARNIERNGFSVAVYDRTSEQTDKFISANTGKNFVSCKDLTEMVAALEKPRKVLVMITAGSPVDSVLAGLKPLLEAGDIVVDLGNSHYQDTERRQKECAEEGTAAKITFLGVGVSGGEEGALNGPSIMPGGDKGGWEQLAAMFDKISAKAPTPCHIYIGPGGSGHFVKMVHNGIEYADMQLIAEAYHLLREVGSLKPEALSSLFSKWNQGPLSSFLIEITSKIFSKKDEDDKTFLVDKILDKAEQKGTGRWTAEAALLLGVATPSLAIAVDSRTISSEKDLRVKAATILDGDVLSSDKVPDLENIIHDALYAAKIIAYAQGFSLLSKASSAWSWNLDLGKIASIWRGGCIIRAAFLDKITEAYTAEPKLQSLLLSSLMREELAGKIKNMRRAVVLSANVGIPLLAISSALNYYDALRTANLPLNLTQAQRDFFGAHTFERIDRPGKVHVEWE